MPHDSFQAPQTPLRSTWREEKLLLRGKLTDKKIAAYEKRGFYDPAWREARKQYWARQKARRDSRREGNFVREADGRLVYSPVST